MAATRLGWWPSTRGHARWPLWATVGACVILVVEGLLASVGTVPLVLVVPVALLPLALTVRAPRTVTLITLGVFLPLVGLLRRLTGSYTAQIDPFNLIGPLVALGCLASTLKAGERRPKTALGGAVGVLVVLGLVEILNPLQGGPLVGLVGAGLFIGPLIWFYLGQALGDAATLSALLRILRIIALVTAAYGMNQLIFGFTGFEARWIAVRSADYVALRIAGSVRPFSTFASGAEYSYFLVLGAVLFFAWRAPVGRPLRAVVVIGLLLAAFYAGSRSIFVTGVAAVVIIALVRRGRGLGASLLMCVGFTVAALALVGFIAPSAGTSTADKIRNRTLEGLADPFNPNVSTLGLHLQAMTDAVKTGLGSPIGSGAGLVNAAGTKLGSRAASAENDVPNMILAYGWAGLVILLVMVVRAYRVVRDAVASRRSDLVAPAVFAVALFGVWFAGQLYAVSSLVWFFLGSLDRQVAHGSDEDGSAEHRRLQPGGPVDVAAVGAQS